MIKKRILSAILAVAMILTFVPAFAAGEFTIKADSVTIAEGTETVSVDIVVENNPGIGAAIFGVGYDSDALEIASVTVGTVFATADIQQGVLTANPYCISASAVQDNTNNGVLVTINFNVKAGATAGEYAIDLKYQDYAEGFNDFICSVDQGVEIVPTFVDGAVVVESAGSSEPSYSNFTIEAETVTIADDAETVSVPINVYNNPGIGAAIFGVGYDSNALEIASVTVGTVFATADIQQGVLTANPYCISASAVQDNTNNGVLVTINFNVKAGATAGEYAIDVKYQDYAEGFNDFICSVDQGIEIVPDFVDGAVVIEGEEPPAGPTYTTTALKYAEGALTLEAAEAITGKVVVVSYTDEGKRLVQAQFIDVDVDADSATPITFNVAAGTSYKAMLWLDNVNCKPLIDAIGW